MTTSPITLQDLRRRMHLKAKADPARRFWGGATQDALANWQAASAQDAHGLFADPGFVNPAGADGVLGFSTANGGYNGGLDDNFYLAKNSPAIDHGNASAATAAADDDIGAYEYSQRRSAGLYNPSNSVFYLRNSNDAGGADNAFGYGPAGAGWLPVIGDWDSDGRDSVGLYDPVNSVFYLRNSNSPGGADVIAQFNPGSSNAIPIVGEAAN